VEHYLSEIARVLAPRGRCLISYFLLNEDSRRNPTFTIVRDGYATVSADVPETAIALAILIALRDSRGRGTLGSAIL